MASIKKRLAGLLPSLNKREASRKAAAKAAAEGNEVAEWLNQAKWQPSIGHLAPRLANWGSLPPTPELLPPLLRTLLEIMQPSAVMEYVRQYLRPYEYEVLQHRAGAYMVLAPKGEAEIHPIALVGHCDTIPRLQGVNLETRGGIVRNMAGGGSVLGADDRAGVYGTVKVVEHLHEQGHPLPLLILTDGEETGGTGVTALMSDMLPYASEITLFLELDRANANDFVYYSYDLPTAINMMAQSYGYVEAQGSYSDVATITDTLRTPHLNLSIGYYQQHSKLEHLVLSEMEASIEAVKVMMELERPEPSQVSERPLFTSYRRYGSYGQEWAWWDSEGPQAGGTIASGTGHGDSPDPAEEEDLVWAAEQQTAKAWELTAQLATLFDEIDPLEKTEIIGYLEGVARRPRYLK